LSDNVIYPAEAASNAIQGRVVVKFIVDRTGTIRDVVILQSLHPLLDKEALRAINTMPKWIPGKQNGEAVSVYFQLPVSFRLSN
jgi:protein TonB